MGDNNSRYKIIFKNQDVHYINGTELLLIAQALTRDTVKDKLLAQLKFQNIGKKEIHSISVLIECTSIDNQRLPDVQFQYLDLNLKMHDSIGDQIPIYLDAQDIRKIKVSITQIVYENEEIIHYQDALPVKVQLDTLKNILAPELMEQYKRNIGNRLFDDIINYIPHKEEDYWVCVCGTVNNKMDDCCYKCNKSVQEELTLLDTKELQDNLNIFKKQEEEKQEQQKKVNKRALCIISVTAAIIFVSVGMYQIYKRVIIPEQQYKQALSAYQDKDYEEAIKLLEKLDDYKDSEELVEKSRLEEAYQQAIAIYDKGDYENALPAFEKNMKYKDTQYYIGMCYFYNEEWENSVNKLKGIAEDSQYFKNTQDTMSKCKEELNAIIYKRKYNEGIQMLRNGHLNTALSLFNESNGYEKAEDYIKKTQEVIDAGWIGIYQQEEDTNKYLEVIALINIETMEPKYQFFYQDSVSETEISLDALPSDGVFVIADTFDNTVEATYTTRLITKSTHQFQPDLSVYSSKGTKGFGGTSDVKRKITLVKNQSGIQEEYHYSGVSFGNKPFDNTGTNQYKKIADCK